MVKKCGIGLLLPIITLAWMFIVHAPPAEAQLEAGPGPGYIWVEYFGEWILIPGYGQQGVPYTRGPNGLIPWTPGANVPTTTGTPTPTGIGTGPGIGTMVGAVCWVLANPGTAHAPTISPEYIPVDLDCDGFPDWEWVHFPGEASGVLQPYELQGDPIDYDGDGDTDAVINPDGDIIVVDPGGPDDYREPSWDPEEMNPLPLAEDEPVEQSGFGPGDWLYPF